jgi:hypothetical protein
MTQTKTYHSVVLSNPYIILKVFYVFSPIRSCEVLHLQFIIFLSVLIEVIHTIDAESCCIGGDFR